MTFLNVFNLGRKPAELTPKNLKDLENNFLLFLLPLLPLIHFGLFFLMLILICFLKCGFFIDSFLNFVSLKVVPGSLEPSEKPTVEEVLGHSQEHLPSQHYHHV